MMLQLWLRVGYNVGRTDILSVAMQKSFPGCVYATLSGACNKADTAVGFHVCFFHNG